MNHTKQLLRITLTHTHTNKKLLVKEVELSGSGEEWLALLFYGEKVPRKWKSIYYRYFA